MPGIAAIAASWALAFAAVHLAWALGLRIGLPSDVSMRADPVLLAVDIAAIPLCIVAAVAALRARRHRWALYLCVATAAFALLHSIPPLTGALLRWIDAQPVAAHERARYALFLYEPYWLIGGTLFALVAWLSRRPR